MGKVLALPPLLLIAVNLAGCGAVTRLSTVTPPPPSSTKTSSPASPPSSPPAAPPVSPPTSSPSPSPPLSVETSEIATGQVSVSYNTRLAATGGTSPYLWSFVSGSLPDGLVLDEPSGVITGTPAKAGSGSFVSQVEDAVGQRATKTVRTSIEAGSWATAYYVDSAGGNDANPGTSDAAPWRTIAKVNASVFLPGDQVLFKRGDIWREELVFPSSGDPGRPIVIDAYGHGPDPVISGADVVPVTGWTLCTNCQANVWRTSVNVQSNVVLFDGMPGNRQAALSALANNLDWFCTANTLYVRFAGNSDYSFRGPVVEIGQRKLGIGLFGIAYLTVQNLEVEAANGLPTNAAIYAQATHTGRSSHGLNLNHLTVSQGAGDGVRLEDCDACIVQVVTVSGMGNGGIALISSHGNFPITSGAILGNTVSNNRYDGIYTRGCAIGGTCEGATNPNGLFLTGLIIAQNTVHDNGEGIYIQWTNHSSVSANISYANTDTRAGGEGGGVEIEASSDNIVQKNLIYGNRMSGVELSNDSGAGTTLTGSSNNRVEYNAIHDNGEHGLFSNAAPTEANSFLYNVVWNHRNGACFLADGVGHQFYGNTCWNNSTGVDLYTSPTTAVTANIRVANNIIASSLKYAVRIESGVSAPSLMFDHNDYFLSSETGFRWFGTIFDFSSWQSSFGFDAHSFLGDPQFVSLEPSSASEFAVSPSSPTIRAGAPLGSSFANGLDAASAWPGSVKVNSQGGAWNVGAFIKNP
jgi:parallel beta helix pectate lyase-like protein/putative Ig domain-containing protein